MMYPADYYTEQGLRFRVSEIIREKVFSYTSQELPHSVYTAVEEIEETKKMYKIAAYVYVETESQKYIIIGKGGALITKIGTEARIELE
jgi:GTP-binding protein Era